MKIIGIHSILERCEEDGDCLLWKHCTNGSGFPYAYSNGRSVNLRRLVWELHNEKSFPRNLLASTSCHNPRCLNPNHVYAGTRRAVSKAKAQIGCYGRPASVARMTQTMRARAPKLTMEIAREIRRDEDLSEAELARKWGVHKKMIYEIKRGTAWAEEVSNSSVFSWRPAV